MADKKGNTGTDNTGENNSGDGNSGNSNSGHSNSGYGNSANRESGIFCSAQGKVRMFNKPTDLTWEEINHPHFDEFYLNQWIDKGDMTDKEKKSEPEFHARGGYLKTVGYEEAWASFWKDTSEENRQKFLDLPNFSQEIFKEITSIDVEAKDEEMTLEQVCKELGRDVKIIKK